MKLTFISPDKGGGGIYRFYREFSRALTPDIDCRTVFSDPFGSVVDRFHPVQETSDFGSASQPSVYAKDALGMLPQLLRMIIVAIDGWRDARQYEPDIVEVCDWPLGFVPAVLDQAVPYVVQCHGSMGQIAQHDPQRGQELEAAFVQMLEPQLLACAHRVQSYSRQNAQSWEGMTGRTVSMVRPAFALPDLSEDTDSGVAATAAVFGRLQRWKGPHILCEALTRLARSAPVVDWYGAVKPWQTGHWPTDRRLAADFPNVWGSRLRHHAAVPRDVVARLQRRAIFNVVPSTWDVFNFTAVESMAAARPTIVSTGAGASELIVDGQNGFLFENENPDSLATAIERVMTLSERRRREIGHAGRETVRTELDPAFIAEQRRTAYEEAIRSFRTNPPPKPNSWLVDLLTPRTNGRYDPGPLLEIVPMRAIAGHAKDRLLRKLGWTSR